MTSTSISLSSQAAQQCTALVVAEQASKSASASVSHDNKYDRYNSVAQETLAKSPESYSQSVSVRNGLRVHTVLNTTAPIVSSQPDTVIPALIEIASIAVRAIDQPDALQEFRNRVDDLFPGPIDFRIWRNVFYRMREHPLMNVCGCRQCRRSGLQIALSPFGQTDRADFMIALLREITRVIPERNTPLRIASIGAGGCFSELLIAAALHHLNYRNTSWTLIDPYFLNQRPTVEEGDRLMHTVAPTTNVEFIAESLDTCCTNSSLAHQYNVVFMINDQYRTKISQRAPMIRVLAGEQHVCGVLSHNQLCYDIGVWNDFAAQHPTAIRPRYVVTNHTEMAALDPQTLSSEENRELQRLIYDRYYPYHEALAEHFSAPS